MRHLILLNLFKLAQQVAQGASSCIIAGNYKRAKQYFAWAEKMLREGTNRERLAIANVFVFSLANSIDRLGQERNKVLELLPPSLHHEYCEQINACGS